MIGDDLNRDLERWKKQVDLLKTPQRVGGRTKPHQLVLHLAVLDVAEAGRLGGNQNRIYLDRFLQDRFRVHFGAYQEGTEQPEPAWPLRALRSAEYWRLRAVPGREEEFQALLGANRPSTRATENVCYAELADYALRVVANPDARDDFGRFIRGKLESQRSKT